MYNAPAGAALVCIERAKLKLIRGGVHRWGALPLHDVAGGLLERRAVFSELDAQPERPAGCVIDPPLWLALSTAWSGPDMRRCGIE